MPKISFKAFITEETIQSKVIATVRNLFDPDITLTNHPDDSVFKRGKRIAHKFVDTPDGAWVVDVFSRDGEEVARATPPKSRGDDVMYFVRTNKLEPVEEAAVFEAAAISEARMNNVIGTIFPSKLFSYSKSTKTFTGEASELHDAHLKQLWNDSADAGFGIKSEKTGEVALFVLHETKKDNDHDVTHWNFSVYNPKNDPKLNGLKAVVYSD